MLDDFNIYFTNSLYKNYVLFFRKSSINCYSDFMIFLNVLYTYSALKNDVVVQNFFLECSNFCNVNGNWVPLFQYSLGLQTQYDKFERAMKVLNWIIEIQWKYVWCLCNFSTVVPGMAMFWSIFREDIWQILCSKDGSPKLWLAPMCCSKEFRIYSIVVHLKKLCEVDRCHYSLLWEVIHSIFSILKNHLRICWV